MRNIRPKFSEEKEYIRDVQVVLDENYINYFLFQLFYKDKVYSLTDTIFEYLPEEYLAGGVAVRGIMSSQVWAFLFPELTEEYEGNQRIDFRCGWNKDYLEKGKLSSS